MSVWDEFSNTLNVICGGKLFNLEHQIAHSLHHLKGDDDPSPAQWAVHKTANGAFYLTPVTQQGFHLTSYGFQRDYRVTAEAAGLAATLWACSHLSGMLSQSHGEHGEYMARAVTENYHRLQDWLRENEFQEREAILAILD